MKSYLNNFNLLISCNRCCCFCYAMLNVKESQYIFIKVKKCMTGLYPFDEIDYFSELLTILAEC